MVRDVDWRGHDVLQETTGRYAYCSLCFIARRVRDVRYIAVKPCVPRGERVVEGDVMFIKGHHAKLTFHTWKKHALRPRFCCLACDTSWWATATPKQECFFVG